MRIAFGWGQHNHIPPRELPVPIGPSRPVRCRGVSWSRKEAVCRIHATLSLRLPLLHLGDSNRTDPIAQTATSTPVTPVASLPVPSPGQAMDTQWPPQEWNVRPGKPSAYLRRALGLHIPATSSLPSSQASHASPLVGAFGLGRISSYGATKPSGEPAFTQPYPLPRLVFFSRLLNRPHPRITCPRMQSPRF
jgi:hypothetical protein